MIKQTTQNRESSSIIWNNLEEMVRMKVREFIQSLLEAEVEELLGRQKSERRQITDSETVYRNGYGKERRLTLGCGTIKLRRPRVRGLEGRFESQVLPLFSRRTREVNQLIPELYLHGLALGDFDHDGSLDAMFANELSPTVVWLNDGHGSFRIHQIVDNASTRIALGDLNGDGYLDALSAIVTYPPLSRGVTVLLWVTNLYKLYFPWIGK